MLVLLGLLGGCDRTGPPAPVDFRSGGSASLAQAQTQPGPHPDKVTVAGGETLYGIAHRTGVPVRAIIDANNLQPPYLLRTGSTLALPQVHVHIVQSGDTMATVARLYGVEASTLAATNHRAPPFLIFAGETLILPAAAEAAHPVAPPVTTAPPMIASAPPAAPVTSMPLSAMPNAAPPPLPPVSMPLQQTAARLSPVPSPGPQTAPPVIVAAVPPPATVSPLPPTNTSLPGPLPPPAPQIAAPPLAELPILPMTGKGFLWPVRGRVIATYGTTAQGTHNDGINIAAAAGTPVLAADAGEVAYAGNELKGYGNLVLVKHDNGYITAYAHNETLLVKRGQHVTRGQPIAKVGATGTVTEPQLHFEVRRGAHVLDPMELLPTQAATASR